MALLVSLDAKSKTPLYRQIFQQIKEMIEKNVLPPGTCLPSSRKFAQKLGVNRTTVYNAYQELWGQGYIDSFPGSAFVVRAKVNVVSKSDKLSQSIIAWPSRVSLPSDMVHKALQKLWKPAALNGGDRISFAALDMDAALFPVDNFRRCLNQVMLTHGNDILKYGTCAGFQLLREYIAKRLQLHGITASVEEVLITNGSQHAIDLILRVLTTPGSKIAIEMPTYALIWPLLKYYQVKVVGIPMKEDGMDIDSLRKALEQEKIAFVYTIPNFHNPTGITTTQAHREALLSLCEQYRVPLVEDGFEEEMKYFGKVPLPIKSMDKNGIVIYLGTFSKVLFPGARIGWIVADSQFIECLLAIKRFSELSSSMLIQATVYEFCRQGYYDLHVRHMHKIFRRRMQAALDSLSTYLPKDKAFWFVPTGGYLFWVKLAEPALPKKEFYRILSEHRVEVSPGDLYFPQYWENGDNLPASRADNSIYFRISISMLTEEQITEGMRRLGTAIACAYAQAGQKGDKAYAQM